MSWFSTSVFSSFITLGTPQKVVELFQESFCIYVNNKPSPLKNICHTSNVYCSAGPANSCTEQTPMWQPVHSWVIIVYCQWLFNVYVAVVSTWPGAQLRGKNPNPCNLSMKSLHRHIKSKEEVVAPLVQCLLSLFALNLYLFSDRRALSLCMRMPRHGGFGAVFPRDGSDLFSKPHLHQKMESVKIGMYCGSTPAFRGWQKGLRGRFDILRSFQSLPDCIDLTRRRHFVSTCNAPITFHLVYLHWREC